LPQKTRQLISSAWVKQGDEPFRQRLKREKMLRIFQKAVGTAAANQARPGLFARLRARWNRKVVIILHFFFFLLS